MHTHRSKHSNVSDEFVCLARMGFHTRVRNLYRCVEVRRSIKLNCSLNYVLHQSADQTSKIKSSTSPFSQLLSIWFDSVTGGRCLSLKQLFLFCIILARFTPTYMVTFQQEYRRVANGSMLHAVAPNNDDNNNENKNNDNNNDIDNNDNNNDNNNNNNDNNKDINNNDNNKDIDNTENDSKILVLWDAKTISLMPRLSFNLRDRIIQQ